MVNYENTLDINTVNKYEDLREVVSSDYRSNWSPQRIAGTALTIAILALTIFAMIKVGAVHHMSADKIKELVGLSFVALGGIQGVFNLCVGESLRNTQGGNWHGFAAHIFSHVPLLGLNAAVPGTRFDNFSSVGESSTSSGSASPQTRPEVYWLPEESVTTGHQSSLREPLLATDKLGDMERVFTKIAKEEEEAESVFQQLAARSSAATSFASSSSRPPKPTAPKLQQQRQPVNPVLERARLEAEFPESLAAEAKLMAACDETLQEGAVAVHQKTTQAPSFDPFPFYVKPNSTQDAGERIHVKMPTTTYQKSQSESVGELNLGADKPKASGEKLRQFPRLLKPKAKHKVPLRGEGELRFDKPKNPVFEQSGKPSAFSAALPSHK